MSIVVELKVIETTANSAGKFNLFVGISANSLADRKRLMTCRIEYVLQAGQEFGMRCPRAQAAEASPGQRRIDPDESVFADIKRHREPLVVSLQAGCGNHTERNENKRSCPLR